MIENASEAEALALSSRWTLLLGRLRNYRVFAQFSFASIVFNVVTMAANIIVLRWVEPEAMGLWQSLFLIQTYSLIVQGGVLNGLNRELPYSMGASDNKIVAELAGTAQSISIGGAALLLLGAVGICFFPLDFDVRLGAAIVLVGSAAYIYWNYLTVTYRADNAFEALGWLRIVQSVFTVVTLPMVYYFGYSGLAYRFLFITLAGVLLNHIYRPLHVPLRFSGSHVVRLLKVGMPIFVSGYLLMVSGTFPRVILLSESGVKLVGLFAPIYAAMTLMQMLPESIAQYIYPHMSYRYGKSGDPKSLWPLAWKMALGIMVISLPGLVVCVWAVPWIIKSFFPLYVESIGAVKWGLMSGIFLGASISVNALFSLKAWLWTGVYTTGRVLSSYLLPLILFYKMSNPLEGIAAGYLIAQGFSFFLAMYCIYRATHVNFKLSEENAA